jgi:hypothetical protein
MAIGLQQLMLLIVVMYLFSSLVMQKKLNEIAS